jgi:serine/threonine protein kinase
MGSHEYKQTLQLKPHEKQTINLAVTEVPSLIALSIRNLEAGFPGRLEIHLESNEPFIRELCKNCEAILDAPGQYSLIIENSEDFEQNIEINMTLKRITILREAKYILEEKLGRRTYLINVEGKKYVYKILPFKTGDEMRKEILKSLMLWSQLEHYGIPRLVEINLDKDFYIVEYAEGMNLEEYRSMSKLQSISNIQYIKSVLQVTHKALEVLEYAKLQEIIHGDIKPSNIIFHEGSNKVFIIDWEICRKVNESSPLYLRGTYPPPEVIKDGVYSETSDIYSMGITLALLLGWSGDKGTILIPSTFKGIDQKTLERLSSLIRKMTEPNPLERLKPSDAAELVEEILNNL